MCFWSFYPCIDGFKYCKPVISIDGTHLYGKYQEKLLVAMATDTNNKIFPLAFTIVDYESGSSWRWFLQCLRDMIGHVICGKEKNQDYLPYTYLMSESVDMRT